MRRLGISGLVLATALACSGKREPVEARARAEGGPRGRPCYLDTATLTDLQVLSSLYEDLDQTYVEYFLDRGADLDSFTSDGGTLLFFASPEGAKDANGTIDERRTYDVLAFLAGHGVDLHRKNHAGVSALERFRKELEEVRRSVPAPDPRRIENRSRFIRVLESYPGRAPPR